MNRNETETMVIGVDMGATKVKSARITLDEVERTRSSLVSADGSMEQVVKEVIDSIAGVWDDDVQGIGIGVPSVVDVKRGVVYDVQNIPSWTEVPIKDLLEQHFAVPTYVNNDANCFALGEKHFGKGRTYRDMIGLIIGTGMAAGIIIDDKLYNGANCGAGEVGMIPYLDHHFEYYCSGQFFEHVHGITGVDLHSRAENGDVGALDIFSAFGQHLANGIMTVLYAYDPGVIVLGGSVSKSFAFFEHSLFTQLRTFPYRSVLENLKIEISENEDVAVLGAAALHYNALLSQNDKLMVE